ncbi:MAG: D-alanyl-D-alanine carboxypeptidase [Clostridiales bacterium]|nr:D-alanyl-D-alanine carboxypeptidase [Clostridiales bacterium]
MRHRRVLCCMAVVLLTLWTILPCISAEETELSAVIGETEALPQSLERQINDLSVYYPASGAVMTPQQTSESFSPMGGEVLLMTALLASEEIGINDSVAIPKEAPWPGRLQASMGLKAGETVPSQDLLAGMLLTGAQDSAYALAQHIGGSTDGFVQRMNQKASELGMTQTSFSNPAGIEEESATTTVQDMMRLIRAVAGNKRLMELLQLQQHTTASGRLLQNQCPMMDQSGRQYNSKVSAMVYGRNDRTGFRAIVFSEAGSRGAAFLMNMKPARTYESTVQECISYLMDATEDVEANQLVRELVEQLDVEKDGVHSKAIIGADQSVTLSVAKGTEIEQSGFTLTLDSQSLPEKLEIGGSAGVAKCYYQGQWVADISLVAHTVKRPVESVPDDAEALSGLEESLQQIHYGWIKWAVGAVLLGAVVLAAVALYNKRRMS